MDNVFGSTSELERKSSIAVLSPRLEIQTARRIGLWRAVFRLVQASYAVCEALARWFKNRCVSADVNRLFLQLVAMW